MFYEGDLQSGISQALQESKLVACFVTDEGEESQLWENDFLAEPALKSSLSQETILLRLKAGSQEAEYLAAIFPLPKVPTLVIIQGGELKEYIAAGVPKDEFVRRIMVHLESRSTAGPSEPVPVQAQDPDSTIASDSNVLPSQESLRAGNLPTAPAINNPASSTAAGEATGKATSNADGQAKEQKKLDKGKQKADSGDRKPSETESKYVQILKKQQQEKKDERARILKRVEDDKIQRRQAAAERKAEAERAKDKPKEPAEVGSNRPAPRKSRQYEECALQIRLFDGSTIRSRFPSSATLRVDVRPWIDQHQDGNTAYTFKEVLTPLPNKNITISDEEQSLQSQGLVPSATLIIVPVQGSISAYDSSGGAGLVSRGVSAGYGLASWGTGMVTGLVGSLIGGGPAAQPQEEQSNAPVSTDPSTSRINVRTLRDQDRRDDQQFYNGNALNFEPRNDDDEKKDD